MARTLFDLCGMILLAFAMHLAALLLFPDLTPEGDPGSSLAALMGTIVRPEVALGLMVPANGRDPIEFARQVSRLTSAVAAANLLLAMSWYFGVTLFYSVKYWQVTALPRRLWWVLFALACAISQAPLFLVTPLSGAWLVLAFDLTCPWVVFFLGTCLFSPLGHKYTAPLSAALRRW